MSIANVPAVSEVGAAGRRLILRLGRGRLALPVATMCLVACWSLPAAAQTPTVTYGCGSVSPGTPACSTPHGTSVRLYWTSTQATRCLVDGSNLGLSSNGNYSSLPVKGTSTSTIVCTGPGGSASATITMSVSGLAYADTFPGADASEQINAAIQSLPASTGGTVDATRFVGTQILTNTIRLDRPVHLLLGNNVFEFRGGAPSYQPATDATGAVDAHAHSLESACH
jgi:hypothetical protein